MTSAFSSVKIALLCFVVFLDCQCGIFSFVPMRETPPANWERIFFQVIDDSTRLSNFLPLRKTPLSHDDLEVRVWRGFGLANLEGLIFKRTNGEWLAIHIDADDYVKPNTTAVKRLSAPKSGWKLFWSNVEGLGLLSLPDSAGEECHARIDGSGYVVEISKGGVYRTYHYPSNIPECLNSLQMDLIGETIGIEFHDGASECKTAEWFPCSAILKNRRLDKDLEKE